MSQTIEARLAELEIKLGLADDHLDELNRTIFRQQQQIDLLQRQMRELSLQINASSSTEATETRDLRDDIPPHY